MSKSTHTASAATPVMAPLHRDGRYRNHAPTHRLGFLKTLRVIWVSLFGKPRNTRPAGEIPVVALSRQLLLAAPNNSVFRLGHSTVLLKLRNQFFLTDPVFSERASPVQWAGPHYRSKAQSLNLAFYGALHRFFRGDGRVP